MSKRTSAASRFAIGQTLLLATATSSARCRSRMERTRNVREQLLVRGGTVISMDSTVGDFANADVHVVDGRIARVGPSLEAGEAHVIDAAGTIVIPGFVDTHRHTWETVVRGLLPSCTLGDYIDTMHNRLGAVFGPADVFAGTLAGSLEALNAGVTTIVDWSHCNRPRFEPSTRMAVEAAVRGGRARGAMNTRLTPGAFAPRIFRRTISS
jgi:5-methylthioadenosine/S-adenosylhomocysteine deaminase